MNATAPTRATNLHQRRVRLVREPAAAGQARSQVREAIRAWHVPVDPDVAILLTSDLVTNAITHGAGATVTLAIRCSRGQLRVDVYDASRSLPPEWEGPDDTGAGPGLALVAMLADEWDVFRTPAGQGVYFALAFQAGLDGEP